MAQRTPEGALLTDLILECFRLNGRLLAAGDRMTQDLKLSSARWQVMGAIDQGPLPVAQIARTMGLTRQAVQRVTNALVEDGLVWFQANPNHRRAQLVALTPAGRAALDEVTRRQIDWSDALAAGVTPAELGTALSVLRTLRARLEATDRTGEVPNSPREAREAGEEGDGDDA